MPPSSPSSPSPSLSDAPHSSGSKLLTPPRTHIEFVKQQIHGWLDELLDAPQGQDLKQSFGKMLTLRNYILSPVLDASEIARYLDDPEVRTYMARYQALCASNEVRFERQMSTLLRQQNDNEALVQIIRGYYADIYRLLARSEIFLSAMNAESTVAMVGSGAMPLSLLFMQRYSGARMIGIDCSATSLACGREYIDFLTAQHPQHFQRAAIALECADGAAFDYGMCDIVVLSIHLPNKRAVIERIIATAPRGRPVVIVERQVQGLGQYFYRNYGFDPAGLPLLRMDTLCSSLLQSTAYRLMQEAADAGQPV
ncbi:nicotianamine synthase family protein [Paraburkholderia hayleyella]|uniref:nicotianamine synthase family protein n=1 Tax=Paraburkholderia hayleyella TaxID=2152889 RepID=UPI0012919B06|nr:class I SAM-dependent methyltransferase [Paraburkholderia hayleyella]